MTRWCMRESLEELASVRQSRAVLSAGLILVLHRDLPDLQRMKLLLLCGRVVGTEVGILFGAIKA